MISPYKRYLGDGAYVEYDGQDLILTTSNGIEDTNEIFLGPQEWAHLLEYVKDMTLPQSPVQERP